MSNSREEDVCLGYISAAHGLRGEVFIHSYTRDPGNIAKYGTLHDETGNTYSLKILQVSPPHKVTAAISGIRDRNAAEALKGTALYVSKGRLPALPADEYYFDDLVGLKVLGEAGDIGVVEHVRDYGAGVFLEILKNTEVIEAATATDAASAGSKPKSATLPFNRDSVLNVDLHKREILINEEFLLF